MIKGITCGKTLGVLALLLAGSVGSALADQTSVTFQFTGVGDGVTWTGWAGTPGNAQGVYVSPYKATDDGPNTYPNLTIYCLDWNHEVDPPSTWTADVVNLDAGGTNDSADPLYQNLYYANSTSAPTLTDSGGTDSLTLTSGLDATQMYDRYLEAAYLFSLETDPATGGLLTGASAPSATEQQEINVAAWTLFLDASPLTGGSSPGNTSLAGFANCINSNNGSCTGSDATFANAVYYYLQCAQAHVVGGIDNSNGCTKTTNPADFTGADWYAVTPYPKVGDPGNLTQEFLVYSPTGGFYPNTPPSVPEPQAILLFGTLVGILGVSRYRRQKRA